MKITIHNKFKQSCSYNIQQYLKDERGILKYIRICLLKSRFQHKTNYIELENEFNYYLNQNKEYFYNKNTKTNLLEVRELGGKRKYFYFTPGSNLDSILPGYYFTKFRNLAQTGRNLAPTYQPKDLQVLNLSGNMRGGARTRSRLAPSQETEPLPPKPSMNHFNVSFANINGLTHN
eukprot:NODE_77_length_23806_cov_0.393892.p11 type:complete len:176 gc:universal NODE_77_length_23806_cov_0.393892:14383-13856(-)